MCLMVQVLNQDETPLLYSLVFGEGVVNDATSVVLFNALKSFDLSKIDHRIALTFMGNFLYLFFTSTVLGAMVILLFALFVSFCFIIAYQCMLGSICFNPQFVLFADRFDQCLHYQKVILWKVCLTSIWSSKSSSVFLALFLSLSSFCFLSSLLVR